MALPAGVVVSRALLVQKQVDLERVQLGQECDQILQAAAQPIDAPGHHHVELPAGGGSAQGIEGRALVAALGAPMP
jgi:hypothetical protein